MCKLSTAREIAKNRLALSGIDTFEADYIISAQFNIPITEIPFTNLDLKKSQYKKFIKNVNLRCRHKPVTKIFKKAYFYGNEFVINKNVLSPRFETELLVEKALEYINENDRVLDLCTGSGCIAISLSKAKKIYAEGCDISKKALKIARKNNKKLGTNVEFYISNMFEKVQGKFQVIVSNPPYIETETISKLDKEVKENDPYIALNGGNDGLDFYREIANNIKNYLLEDGVLLMEIGYNQGETVKELFMDFAKEIHVLKDYNNNDRIVVVRV